MIKLLTYIVALGLLTTALGDQVPNEWTKRYEEEVKTITTLNLKGYKAYLAKDFVWLTADGKKKTYKQTMAELDDLFKAKSITGYSKPTKVVTRKDLVDVTYQQRFKFDLGGGVKFDYYGEGVDTWQKIDNRWQIVKTVEKISKQTPVKE